MGDLVLDVTAHRHPHRAGGDERARRVLVPRVSGAVSRPPAQLFEKRKIGSHSRVI
jgi:hypothetical protein